MISLDLRDDDNLLGYGAGFVMKTFHDTDVPADNQGWYMIGDWARLDPLVNNDPADVPAGFYLHISGKKYAVSVADDFYVNIHWGIRNR